MTQVTTSSFATSKQAAEFMGSVGVIIRNACTKNTETEATNCLDHGLFLIIESCHKQFDKDVLVFGSNSTTRHLKTHKNELS